MYLPLVISPLLSVESQISLNRGSATTKRTLINENMKS